LHCNYYPGCLGNARGISSPKGQPDGLTLLVVAVMPALNEELIYRGFLLGILDKIMPPNHRLFSAPVGWGVIIISLFFDFLHGFWLDDSLAVHINWIALRNATLSGFIFAWLRESSASLVVPVIAHGVEDFLFFLPRMMKMNLNLFTL